MIEIWKTCTNRRSMVRYIRLCINRLAGSRYNV